MTRLEEIQEDVRSLDFPEGSPDLECITLSTFTLLQVALDVGLPNVSGMLRALALATVEVSRETAHRGDFEAVIFMVEGEDGSMKIVPHRWFRVRSGKVERVEAV